MNCKHPLGCERPVRAQGWCNAHYLRWKATGDPGVAEIKRVRPTGEPCAAEGCARPRSKREWCGTHYERWRVHGDASISLVARGNPSYLALHKQVYRRKGKASERQCAHCGSAAQQWAYDHLDPNERIAPIKVRDEVFDLRYSQDPEHYIPLCVPCHRQFDRAVVA